MRQHQARRPRSNNPNLSADRPHGLSLPPKLRTFPSLPVEWDGSSAFRSPLAPSIPASQIPPPPKSLLDTTYVPPKNSTCPTAPPPIPPSPHLRTSTAQKNSR